MSAIRRAIEFASAHSADHGLGKDALAELEKMQKDYLDMLEEKRRAMALCAELKEQLVALQNKPKGRPRVIK